MKLDYYRCKNCNKMFCLDVREYVTKISNYKNYSNKNYFKVRNHCYYTGRYRGAAHSICNLRYKKLKEIPVVFHYGSTYYYHFIIKEPAQEFKEQFECLGENTEKYITFSVPSKKEITIMDKDG